jgi:signal peptidase II
VLKKSFLIVFIVLCLDQALKIWIKTNMTLGQEFLVAGNWFIIHFTENNGMAFGLQFAGEYGKLALSLFRILAVGFLAWYIIHLANRKTGFGVLFAFSLSAFYGIFFSESTYFDVARFMPAEGGYSTLLHGKVVDMFYFPIFEGNYPQWVPFWGGQSFIFFRPVFNIADSAITTGVLILVIFQRQFFNSHDVNPVEMKEENGEEITTQPGDNTMPSDK